MTLREALLKFGWKKFRNEFGVVWDTAQCINSAEMYGFSTWLDGSCYSDEDCEYLIDCMGEPLYVVEYEEEEE